MDRELIENTLHYGFYPNSTRSGIYPEVVEAAKQPPVDGSDFELVERGIEALRAGMDSLATADWENATHVLPISAGLDSRVVLGLLLERVDPCQIVTLSFGAPGAWDYEIGQEVAVVAGVDNRSLDLRPPKFDWSRDSLEAYAGTVEYPNHLFGGYAQNAAFSTADHAIAGHMIVWTGFLGGELAGSHLQKYDTTEQNWQQACDRFARWSAAGTVELTSESFEPTDVLPDYPWLSRKELPYGGQLDFGVRQPCGIAPQLHHDRFQTPFLTEEWASFILNVPEDQRLSRRLFKRIAQAAFPKLFAVPTDSTNGVAISKGRIRRYLHECVEQAKYRWRQLTQEYPVGPRVQYLDYEDAIRKENELAKTIEGLIREFDSRDLPWLSPLEYWHNHQNGENYDMELRKMAALELWLQTHE